MTITVTGSETGLLNSSLSIAGRGDQVGAGNPGHGEQIYVNTGNGNLIVQHQDAYLPSFGSDFQLVRTYNERGLPNDPGHDGKDWSLSTTIILLILRDGNEDYYQVQYGDGSVFEYRLDEDSGLFVTTDGADAFETLEDLNANGNDPIHFQVTRADQSVMSFDKHGNLVSIEDTNGVSMSFFYASDRLARVEDDEGHIIHFIYEVDPADDVEKMMRIEDETGLVLVQYRYDGERLVEAIDREGHSTRYHYTPSGQLERIELPFEQVEDGETVTYETREIQLIYEEINWGDSNNSSGANAGLQYSVTQIVDAEGNVTTFSYDPIFEASNPGNGNGNGNNIEGDVFAGGTTTITDAAGHTLIYTYDEEGYVTSVADQLGYVKSYAYDDDNNLISITDRNAYTTTMTYDDRGNLLTTTDNDGFVTTYTYTDFNKISSTTSAVGYALTTSDDAYYQELRDDILGVAGVLAGNLTTTQQDTLLDRYTTSYAYDANQNLIERVDAGGDITHFEYDAYGNLTKQIVFLDANDLVTPATQQVTQFFYDAFGNNTQTIDPEGVSTFGVYDLFGNLTQFQDGNGNITTYTYDDDNRLLTVTDPLLHVTVNTYDPVGNRTSITDQNGNTVTRVYSQNNHLLAIIDTSDSAPAEDRETSFTYDVVGNRTTSTDAEGRVTTYNYNERRELVEVVTPLVDDENGIERDYTTEYTYDGESNRLTILDHRGNLTQLTYSPGGLLEERTDASGHVTQYIYDANNNQIQIVVGAQLTAERRQVVSFVYDEENQLITRTDAEGAVRTFSYDAPGTVASITDENGYTTDYEYDLNNRLIMEIAPEVEDEDTGNMVRHEVERRYDANGNQIEIIDANDESTHFTFDPDNRLVMVEDANDVKTVYTYDSRNNRTSIQIGVEATVAADGQVTVTDVQNAQVTRYAYDEFNQLIAKTDGLGTAMAESDLLLYQQLRGEILNPGSGDLVLVSELTATQIQDFRDDYTETYTYDRVGNALTITDNEGRVTTNVYDALNRLVSRTDPDVDPAQNGTELFRYDGAGNLAGMTDKLDRTSSFAYDELNRLTSTTDTRGAETTYAYDEFGNILERTRAAHSAVDFRTTSYEYDLNNRLVLQVDPEMHEIVTEYDAVGNRMKVTTGRSVGDATTVGTTTQYFYDALNRNISVIDPESFETVFKYDGAGNMVRLIDARDGIQSFDYDAGNRQIIATDAAGRTTEFDYDVRGNQVEIRTGVQTGNAADVRTTIFVYDAENNLRSVTDADSGVSTRDFDRVYNLTTTTDQNGNTTTMAYDARDRVISITDATGVARDFTYDAVNNVLTETDEKGNLTTYNYDDGNRLLDQTDALGFITQFAYDEANNQVSITQALGILDVESTTHFQYDKDDRLIATTDGAGAVTTYEYDASHNVIAIIDSNGHAMATSDEQIYRDMRANIDPAYDVAAANLTSTQVDELLDARTTRYEYDNNNRVETIIDPLGNETSYTYDANGNRIEVTDQLGNKSVSFYNDNNELSLTVDAEGYATRITYDANGNVASTTLFATALALPVDPLLAEPVPVVDALNDQTTTFEYDKLNRLETRYSAEGYRTQYVYDAAGNRTETHVSQDLGNTTVAITRDYYDELNRNIYTLTAEGYLTKRDYDAAGNVTSLTVYDEIVSVPLAGALPEPVFGDAGRTELFVYDKLNRLTEYTTALDGITVSYTYDVRGNLLTQTNNAGDADVNERQTTEYKYDLADRMTTRINADGTEFGFTLDGIGNVIIQSDGVGLTGTDTFQRDTYFFYDGNNRLIEQVDALGVISKFEYDKAGNLRYQTDAFGIAGVERTEEFIYDQVNQIVEAVNGEGERTLLVYDAAGNQITITEAPGETEERVTTSEYDRDNRRTATIDATGMRSEFDFDGAGNLLKARQAVGTLIARETVSVYDLDNRITSRTDAEGGLTLFDEYDVLGNVLREIGPGGNVIERTYDAVGQILTVTSGVGAPEAVRVTNEYDNRGNVISSTQAFVTAHATLGLDERTSTFEYDILDRVTIETDGEGYSTRFTYDAFGNQTMMEIGLYLLVSGDAGYDANKATTLTFPIVDTFRYDALNRMFETTDGNGHTRRLEFDEVGNRIKSTAWYDNANTSEHRVSNYVYDLANREIEVNNNGGGQVNTQYDEVGNVTQRDTLQSSGVWITKTFKYDDLGRQTEATDSYGTTNKIVYDEVGNILQLHLAAGTGDEAISYSEYDRNSRLTAEIDAEGNRTEYTHDAAGNRITAEDAHGNVANYFFDRRNRMIGVLDPLGFFTQLSFDAASNLIETRTYVDAYTGTLGDFDPFAPTPDDMGMDRAASAEYDRANNLSSATQPDGTRTDYEHDSTGKVRTQINFANTAAPRTQTFVYDSGGRLETFTDVDGVVTTFTYDGANNKIAEEISSPNDPYNQVRRTDYEFNLLNRQITQTFDASGLNIIQRTEYDLVGNITAKIDGNGHRTEIEFDLNNRYISVLDPVLNETTYTYDRRDNVVTITDPLANTASFEYDLNNRLTMEISPEVDIYANSVLTIDATPTKETVYDEVGNVVQLIDANGNKTTRWYDANGNMVAELSGANVLREFTYNATGRMLTETLYMGVLAAADHDPDTQPAGVGEARTKTFEYDIADRLTTVTYPAVDVVTSLDVTDPNNPVATIQNISPVETNEYNEFGEEVANIDRNGNRSVFYYDIKGRLIGSVDAEGYYTRFEYDAQDNVTERFHYVNPLTLPVVASVIPTVPTGTVHQFTFIRDAAGRAIEELSPYVDVYSETAPTTAVNERISTVFTYDDVGNQLTRTIGPGTAEESTDYIYYDGNGRQIAVINGNNVLHTYLRDGNGNITLQKRFYDPVDGTPPSAAADPNLTIADLEALIDVDTSNDQTLERMYDALSRVIEDNDHMGTGTDDDIRTEFRYDANGNQTWKREHVSLTQSHVSERIYDGVNRVINTISPDNSISTVVYDAMGNETRLYTGELVNPVLSFTPTISSPQIDFIGDTFTVTWDTSASVAPVDSWIVWDTVSHSGGVPDDYPAANNSGVIGTSSSGVASFTFPPAAPDERIYFRIVSQDPGNNVAWTAEQSVLIPPRLADPTTSTLPVVEVLQPSDSELTVRVRFEGTLGGDPTLNYGSAPTPGNSVAFSSLGGGLYSATITGVTDPQALVYSISWTDADLNTFTSAVEPFEADTGHAGISTTISSTGSSIDATSRILASFVDQMDAVEFKWRVANSGAPFGVFSIPGTLIGDYYSFQFNTSHGFGSGQDLEIQISGKTPSGQEIILDNFEITTNTSAETYEGMSWALPTDGVNEIGATQLVIINGQRDEDDIATRLDGFMLLDLDESASGSQDYDIFYGNLTGTSHNVDVSQFYVTNQIADVNAGDNFHAINNPSGTDTDPDFDWEVVAYEMSVDATNIPGGVTPRVAWRAADSGAAFDNDVALGDNFDISSLFDGNGAVEFDLKVYYVDGAGNEVIVDWVRVETTDVGVPIGTIFTNEDPSASEKEEEILSETSDSITVLASETAASSDQRGDEVVEIDAGLYLGALDPDKSLPSFNLNLSESGAAGNTPFSPGTTPGYFVENRFNALGDVIATNERDGVWREFGVDANGNIIVTTRYGFEGNTESIVTYTEFDRKDQEVARYGALVDVTDPLLGVVMRREVQGTGYDFAGRIVSRTDAYGGTIEQELDGLGRKISEDDVFNNAELFHYDRLGNIVWEQDRNGRQTTRTFDGIGRMLTETNHLNQTTTFGLDAFGRRTSHTNAIGQQRVFGFDQRDRLTSITDPLSFTTTFKYDGRDNRTETLDANGTAWRQEFDPMGRVNLTIVFDNGVVFSSVARAYDAFGNLISETNEDGRTTTKVYGEFGKLTQERDIALRTTDFVYDDFRRQTNATGPGLKNIVRQYDDAGRVTAIIDNGTGVRTDFQYDVAGNVVSEITDTPVSTADPTGTQGDRTITYAYDALGQMIRWADSSTGTHLNYNYDAGGLLKTTFTDAGHIVPGGTTGIDHDYFYDGADRVTQINSHNTLLASYTYDAVGNRLTYNDGTTVVNYVYDNNGRVTSATNRVGVANFQANKFQLNWTYDNVGNVLTFVERSDFDRDGDDVIQINTKTKVYRADNISTQVTDITQESVDLAAFEQTSKTVTDTVFSTSGNTLLEVVNEFGDDNEIDQTFTYRHLYFFDGRKFAVSATGDATGTSFFTYDANDKTIAVNLGQGDDQDTAAIKRFVYGTDGKILYAFDDDGINDTVAINQTQYLYALGHPVGEINRFEDEDNNPTTTTKIDVEQYNLVQNIDDENPAGAVSTVTAAPGDTLQTIAAAIYGNPSLWFIIAEMNGYSGSETITAGTQIIVPTTVLSGTLTADAHVVYNEGDIIGSTLPNLTSPPPDAGELCLKILAIILVIIVAIVVTVVSYGIGAAIAAPIAAAVTAGTISSVVGTVLTVVAVAAVGAVIGAIGAAITQGILIGLTDQEKFDWTAFAAGAVAGLFSGAAAGIGAAIKAGLIISKVATTVAKIAIVALDTGAEVLSQVITNDGKIDSWASVAGAFVGSLIGVKADSLEAIANKADDAVEALTEVQKGARAAQGLSDVSDLQKKAARLADIASELDLQKSLGSAARTKSNVLDFLDIGANISSEWIGLGEQAADPDFEGFGPETFIAAAGSSLGALAAFGFSKSGAQDAFKDRVNARVEARISRQQAEIRATRNSDEGAITSAQLEQLDLQAQRIKDEPATTQLEVRERTMKLIANKVAADNIRRSRPQTPITDAEGRIRALNDSLTVLADSNDSALERVSRAAQLNRDLAAEQGKLTALKDQAAAKFKAKNDAIETRNQFRRDFVDGAVDALFDGGFLAGPAANGQTLIAGLAAVAGALITGSTEVGIRTGIELIGGEEEYFFPEADSIPTPAIQSIPQGRPPAVQTPTVITASTPFGPSPDLGFGTPIGTQFSLPNIQSLPASPVTLNQLSGAVNGAQVGAQAAVVNQINAGGRPNGPVTAGGGNGAPPDAATLNALIGQNTANINQALLAGDALRGNAERNAAIFAAQQVSSGAGAVPTPGAGTAAANGPLELSNALVSQGGQTQSLAANVQMINNTGNGIRANQVNGNAGAATENNRVFGSLGSNGKLGVPMPPRMPGSPQTWPLWTPGVHTPSNSFGAVRPTSSSGASALGSISFAAATASLGFADGRSSNQQYAAELSNMAASNRVSNPSTASGITLLAAAAGVGVMAQPGRVSNSANNLLLGSASPWSYGQFASSNAFQGFGSNFNYFAGAGGA